MTEELGVSSTELVQTARGDFLVRESGRPSAEPLVLVAGLGDDHTSWDPVLPRLVERYRCITFDNRGIGRSPITAGPYDTRDLARDAEAVAAALGLDAVTAIGSSMGGAICQYWAIQEPARISRLVLSSTWSRPDPFLSRLFSHWQFLAAKAEVAELMQSLALFCLSPGFMEANADFVDEFERAPAPDLAGFRAACDACRTHDSLAHLGDVNQPTLVIAGDFDLLIRPALSLRLAEAMPSATVEMVPAAHMTFWEVPDLWCDRVMTWLE